MKIFGKDGKEEWRCPNPWDYTASNTAAVSIVNEIDMRNKGRNSFTAETQRTRRKKFLFVGRCRQTKKPL
jgi:hypothetical protein